MKKENENEVHESVLNVVCVVFPGVGSGRGGLEECEGWDEVGWQVLPRWWYLEVQKPEGPAWQVMC